MLRIQNRVKHDHAELLSLLDRCSQILKDDRLLLRQMLKETNPELISLLTTYKKKNDLRLLQQELRKLLNKIKGKNVQRTHKENAPSQSKTRQPTIEPSLTLKVRSPTQRSLSKPPQKPPKTSDSKKQENSPRFNEDVKHHLNFEYVSPTKIEQQRQQLHDFEQKLRLYTSGDNFQKLFEAEVSKPKREDIVLASFQNFNLLDAHLHSTQKEPLQIQIENHQTAHKRQPSYVDFSSAAPPASHHHHHNTEIFEKSARKFKFDFHDAIQLSESDAPDKPNQDPDSTKIYITAPKFEFEPTQEPKYDPPQHPYYEQEEADEGSQLKFEPQITEDDIMKKYADLFTAPDFLRQCRASCPTQKTQESLIDSQKFNFLVPCQSLVCPNDWETSQQKKNQLLSQLTSEQVFDEIFPEPTLHKISRAFFRFKMEAIYQQFQNNPTQEELDELFVQIDSGEDGFIDINEMGRFLDENCPHEDRKIFHYLDADKQGYISAEKLESGLRRIGCGPQAGQLAQNYFLECDLLATNKITYWEFYLKRKTEIGGEILKLMKMHFQELL